MPAIHRSYPGAALRDVLRHLGLDHRGAARVLAVTPRTVAAYEQAGAPGWVRLALRGYALEHALATAEGVARALALLDDIPSDGPRDPAAAPPAPPAL